MNRTWIYFCALLLTIVSCHKEDISTSVIDDTPPVVETKYQIGVYGVVENENGQAVENAAITTGSQTITTGKYGVFYFPVNNTGQITGTYLKATAAGYHTGGSRMYANDLGNCFVKITLAKNLQGETIDANQGGTIQAPNGVSITFPANAFLNESQSYTGTVTVLTHYVDPTAPDFLRLIPGDLTGISKDGMPKVLRTYGFVSVTLKGQNGETLTLDKTKGAELAFPVPNGFATNSNATMPLWHFDEVKNRWVEEGLAALVNDKYVAKVSHFSWWNLSIPFEGVSLSVKLLQSSNQAPIINQRVSLSSQIYGTVYSITNQKGSASGRIPKNEALILKVYDDCNKVVFEKEIGPFNEILNHEKIEINDVINKFNTIQGTVSLCTSTSVVPNAFVKRSIGNQSSFVLTDDNGFYSFKTLHCMEDDVTVTAIDFKNNIGTIVTIKNIQPEVYVKNLALCDLTELVELKQDGNTAFGSAVCKAKVRPNETTIFSGSNFILGYNGNGLGTFPAKMIGNNGYSDDQNFTVTIEEYGSANGYIKGSFKGTGKLLSGLNNTVSWSGTFIAKRD
jgi:hypothetical protein